MSKELVLEVLAALPAEFDAEEFLERLTLLEKIQQSREQVQRAETLSFEEMKQVAQLARGCAPCLSAAGFQPAIVERFAAGPFQGAG